MSPRQRTAISLVAACIGLPASPLATATGNPSGTASSAPAPHSHASAAIASAPRHASSGASAHGSHSQGMCGTRAIHGHPASAPMDDHDAASAARMATGGPCMSASASTR
jgi:hypothetical protein